MTNTDIIKCNKCGQVLISGTGCLLWFGKGTSIACVNCGNKYIFGQENAVSERQNVPIKDKKMEIE